MENLETKNPWFAPFVFRDYGVTYGDIFARFGAMIAALDNGEKPDLTGDEVTEIAQLMNKLLVEKYCGENCEA